ncbi:MAG: hypothetical protein Q9163_004008 [Psora crenata]
MSGNEPPTSNGKLESNLNAICRTPKLHRDELLEFNTCRRNRDVVNSLQWSAFATYLPALTLAKNLILSFRRLLQRQVKALCLPKFDSAFKREHFSSFLNPPTPGANCWLTEKARACRTQLQKFYNKALMIQGSLGSASTALYIKLCIQNFLVGRTESLTALDPLEAVEHTYLRRKLREVTLPPENCLLDLHNANATPKLRLLISILEGLDIPNFAGLVFVETRAEVAVLSRVLTDHFCRTQKYTISTFVGEANRPGNTRMICDMADIKNQKQTLEDFRQGRKNLVITTAALEEGIDIAKCSVVICFERPRNLKSFIQRRGRARKSESKFIIMSEKGRDSSTLSTWQKQEERMRQFYMDQMRKLQELRALEEGEETGYRVFEVRETGAKLTLEDAVGHLYHFCATLPADPFLDPKPYFFFQQVEAPDGGHSIEAKIRLPITVDPAVREARSKHQRTTKKMAKRDVAFEAYVALYHFGLIDDYLVPISRRDGYNYTRIEKRPNVLEVNEQFDMWPSIAKQWHDSSAVHGSWVEVRAADQSLAKMIMLLPRSLPPIADFIVYWDLRTIFSISIKPEYVSYPMQTMDLADDTTILLLRSVFRGRIVEDQRRFSARFVPANAPDLHRWLSDYSGVLRVEDANFGDCSLGLDAGLVRDLTRNGAPGILCDTVYAKAEDALAAENMNIDTIRANKDESKPSKNAASIRQPSGILHHVKNAPLLLEVRPLPQRTDFLHEVANNMSVPFKKSSNRLLYPENCHVDRLHFRYAQFAAFVPTILHKVREAIVIDRLCTTVLSSIGIRDRNLVLTTTTSSTACEIYNYERLELLGDSILKFFTSLTLAARNPRYHEGILSHEKDIIVSNGNLASAAVQAGLAQYINTRPFTGHKWRPSYIDDATEVAWLSCPEASHTLYDLYEKQIQGLVPLMDVERLTNYDFKLKNILCEALTHPSYQGHATSSSYQRLEFLGDPILDIIITTEAFSHEPPIPTHRLHLIRTALVNANFLGYLALRHSVSVPYKAHNVDGLHNVTLTSASRAITLVDVMRHGLMAYLHRVLSVPVELWHPKEELGRLSNQDRIEYVMGREGEEGEQCLTCAISVGGRDVARVSEGLSAMECQTRAAEAACRVLRLEGRGIYSGSLQVLEEDRAAEEKVTGQGEEVSESGNIDPLKSDTNDERDCNKDVYMSDD